MMDYSNFCKPFYAKSQASGGLKGITSQYKIAQFFMTIALGKAAATYMTSSDDLYRKWFTGDRVVTADVWGAVVDNFDEVSFSQNVASKINENALSRMFSEFGIRVPEGRKPDKFIFADALTEQFKAIYSGNGEGADIITDAYTSATKPTEFPDYVENTFRKFSKMKTLLYQSEERPFYDFFVCNTIRTEEYYFMRRSKSSDKVIKDVNLEKLLQKAPCTLLVGMGGIGKSMMMRHLFLESIQQYSETGLLPVIITLREFGVENDDLFELIVRSLNRYDATIDSTKVNKLLLHGRCQLLFDGLDEIKAADMDEFLAQLDFLMDRYPNNQMVMSTRRFHSFVSLSRFRVLWMEPFSLEQAVELVEKLKYYEEEPRLKEKFLERLKAEFFKTQPEFASNPLLLTLMFMNFKRFADVPEKQYIFYQQAYDTLLQLHDGDKLTLKRDFHSVKDPSDFTDVFREFCAKSYRKGDYEFDHPKFEKYFNLLHSTEKLDPELMKLQNFIFDVCNSTCLMYEEAQSYHFLHRSFQEYFFADYYSRQVNEVLIKLGRSMRNSAQTLYDDGEAFKMLYQLAQVKVERFIFLPFLEDIFAEEDEQKTYFRFLTNGYANLDYFLFSEEKMKEYKIEKLPVRAYQLPNGPSTVILSCMLQHLHIDDAFILELKGEGLDYKEAITCAMVGLKYRNGVQLMRLQSSLFKESRILEGGILEGVIKGNDGASIEFGHEYVFQFSWLLDAPEKYEKMVRFLMDETLPLRIAYHAIRNYYAELKEKYKNSENLDDDDF